MLLIDNLKPLKIYRKPMFLPTVDDNKKKKSAIFLLTPNYESSKNLMLSDLLINKLRFSSYYIEKDLTYFISSKVMNQVDDVTETYVHDYSEIDFYQSLCEMSTSERNKLKDSDFGLPEKRKYPLTDKSHVKSAIKFFNYVDSEDEAELAKNIRSKMKKYNISSDSVGEKNRLKKYLTEDVGTSIDTIIFDLGNVLVTYDYRKALDEDPNIPDEFVDEIMQAVDDIDKDPALENCNFDEGVKIYKNHLSDNLKQYAKYIYMDYHTCVEVCDYTEDLLSELKSQGYKLYYLSNWAKVGVAIEKQRGVFGFLDYFDGGVFSCDVGLIKPDKKIYEELTLRYGILPDRAIFFDDKKENIEAAKECGLKAVEFNEILGRRMIGGESIEDIISTTSDGVGSDTPDSGRYISESLDLTKIKMWHTILPIKGKKPEDSGDSWDEELYSKTIEDAIKTDIFRSLGDTPLPDEFEVLAYTMGENCSSIFVGRIGVRKQDNELGFDWEWNERSNVSDNLLDYYGDEVHRHFVNESYEVTHTSDKTLYNWIMKNTNYKSNGVYDTNKIERDHEGDCHDFAGYQYNCLKKLGYKTGRLFMIEYSKWNSPGGKTHTACWFIKNNNYYWMETAWGGMEGIHECGSSLTDVKNLIRKNWKFSGNNDKLYMGNVHGVKNGMSLNEYVNACVPEKEDKNYYEKGRVIKESYEIERERGFYHYDGTYNCIVYVKGIDKPLRGRGEILILDPTYSKIYLVPDGKKYKVPGGGFEPDESHLEGTVREAKEEARIEVVGAYDTGVRYVEMFKDNPDVSQKEFDPKNRFYGFYTEIFIGTAASRYNGELDTLDVDNKMTKGHFYDIEKVYDKLIPEHQQALQMKLESNI